MGISVNSIPSKNIPLTDKNGIISPIWHEFLRSFIAATVESQADTTTTVSSITAGSGLNGGGVTSGDVTLNVGTGPGIVVNADDVSVDITNQTGVQAELVDEVLIADSSDSHNIKKTTIQSVVDLAQSSPGGSNNQVQYNNNGAFAGNSGFTYDGAGNISIDAKINMNTNSNAIFWTGGSATAYHFGATAGTPYMRGQDSTYQFGVNSSGFNMSIGSGNTVSWSAVTGLMTVTGLNFVMTGGYFTRSVNAGVTASTTQTQGQGQQTKDIIEVSTVANANDTITLPPALAGRNCLVINNGVNTLKVFPSSGDDLGAGVNTSTTIASGSRKLFVAFDTTNWEPVI